MLLLNISIICFTNSLSAFRLLDHSTPNGFRIQRLHNDFFRAPIPNEELKLPKAIRPTGEILLDRELIARVAELRSFIEDIEFSRGKPLPDDLTSPENTSHDTDTEQSKEKNAVEINEVTLEPIKDLLCEENLLEEVLTKAFEVYRSTKNFVAIDRLQNIANEIASVASKFRKSVAEENTARLLRCYMIDEEDLDAVLEELQKKRALNKYLVRRIDEYINLAGKKFRISDEHPSISENFLRVLKDRIAAQQITNARGTDLFVKTLAQCLQYDDCNDYDRVLKDNIKTIEGLEEFHDWLLDGISYIKETVKNSDKIEKMENIVDVVVRQHPLWSPHDDHIENEH